ncbi:hypothetical protein NFI96_012137, partial [Prochilodus magdalenae]
SHRCQADTAGAPQRSSSFTGRKGRASAPAPLPRAGTWSRPSPNSGWRRSMSPAYYRCWRATLTLLDVWGQPRPRQRRAGATTAQLCPRSYRSFSASPASSLPCPPTSAMTPVRNSLFHSRCVAWLG